ncbi:MAG: hypothetical protein Kow0031_10310 [Anaerolineae bacterium]
MPGLLVVDDIPIIRSTIARIVKTDKPSLYPVIQAATGEEAISQVRLHRPDIILMDIKMPRLDGLQAVTVIRNEHPAAKIIMLTAFEEFSYAQQALRLGAADYLLKPIRPNKLLEALSRVENQLSEERRRQQEMDAVRAQLQQALPLVEANLLESLIRETPLQNIAEIEAMLATLGKNIAMPAVMVFAIKPLPGAAKPLRASEELYRKQQLTNAMRRALPDPGQALISFQWLSHEVILLISTRPQQVASGYLTSLAQTLCHVITSATDAPAVAGVGMPYPRLGDMCLSYSEAWLARYTVPSSGGAVHIARVKAAALQALPGHAADPLEQLLLAVTQNQFQAGLKYLQTLTAQIELDAPVERHSAFSTLPYNRLLVLCARAAMEAGAPPAGVLQLVQQQLGAWSTNARPRQWLLHGFTELMTYVDSTRQQKEPVQSAIEYIHRNLHRPDIRLTDVAEAVNLSPSHLAHLLKTQLGMSYIKFITLARIEAAKKLLCGTDYNINTIAEMVGYRNLTNFYRLFQRETNLTPAAYRRAVSLV